MEEIHYRKNNEECSLRSGKKMNICISINSNYVMPTIVMLNSLFSNNSIDIDIYLLYSSLKENEIEKLVKYVVNWDNEYKRELIPIRIDEKRLGNALVNYHVSVETYFRLFMTEVIPNEVDRILYLDVDLVINKSIEELYFGDFEGKFFIVCEDSYIRTIQELRIETYKRLGIQERQKYFNAGVAVFNMNLLRQKFDLKQALDYIVQMGAELKYWDQDVLNKFYGDKSKFVSYLRYNCMVGIFQTEKQAKSALEKACIIHYAGGLKPWNNYIDNVPHSIYVFYNLFFEYANAGLDKFEAINSI